MAADEVVGSTLARLASAAARFPLHGDDCPNSVMATAAINKAFAPSSAAVVLCAVSPGLVPSDEDTRDGIA